MKKIAAGLLLALLVFIHAEKAIHNHEGGTIQSEKAGITVKSNSFYCSICDYVFAKDAEIPTQTIVSFKAAYLQEQPVYFISSYNKILVAQTSDRGPPTC